MDRSRALAIHPIRHQDCHSARADRAFPGSGEKRERGRGFDLRHDFGLQGPGLGGRQIDAQPQRDRFREFLRNIHQHGHHALPYRRCLHPRQFEAESPDDVRLFHRRLAVPEQRCLRVMVREPLRIAAYLVPGHGLAKGGETGCARLERAAAAEGIRLIGNAAPVDGLTVHAIALVVMNLRDRRIDGDFVKIGPAQAGYLGIHVRVDAACKQRVIAEIQARHDMRGAECHLLRFREKIVGLRLRTIFPTGLNRNQLFRNDLGGVKYIEAEFLPPGPR